MKLYLYLDGVMNPFRISSFEQLLRLTSYPNPAASAISLLRLGVHFLLRKARPSTVHQHGSRLVHRTSQQGFQVCCLPEGAG